MSCFGNKLRCLHVIGKTFRLSRDGATPINKKLLLVSLLIFFACSMSISFVASFLPAFVLTFGYKEEEKGYYAGLIFSSICWGQILSSYLLGWLTDKFGCRPVMIVDLVLLSLLPLTFGLSPNFPLALANRFMFGLINGLPLIGKVLIHNISDDSNQAVYFSLINLAYGLARMVGPFVSGLLSQPAEKYTSVFAKDGFFTQFPFFLPGLAVFVVYCLTITCTVLFLHDTKHSSEKAEAVPLTCQECRKDREKYYDVYMGFAVLNFDDVCISSKSPQFHSHQDLRTLHSVHRKMSVSAPNLDSCKFVSQNDDKTDKGNAALEDLNLVEQDDKKEKVCPHNLDTMEQNEDKDEPNPNCSSKFMSSPFVVLLRNSDVRMTIGLYTILASTIAGFIDTFPIWASTEIQFDGLGYRPQDIGTIFGIISLPVLFVQVLVFTKMEKYLGVKKSLMLLGMILMVVSHLLPTTHVLNDKPKVLWYCVIVLIGLLILSNVCSFSALSMLVNNCIYPSMAGTMNGMTLAFVAIGRSIGPILSGSVFAWSISDGMTSEIGYPFGVNVTFILLSLLFAASSISAVLLPERLNRKRII